MDSQITNKFYHTNKLLHFEGLRSIGLEGFSEDVDMDGFVDPLIDLSSNSVAARTILNSGYQRYNYIFFTHYITLTFTFFN